MYGHPKKQKHSGWRSLAKNIVKCLLLKYVEAEEVSLLDPLYSSATVIDSNGGAGGNPMQLISLNFDSFIEEYSLST